MKKKLDSSGGGIIHSKLKLKKSQDSLLIKERRVKMRKDEIKQREVGYHSFPRTYLSFPRTYLSFPRTYLSFPRTRESSVPLSSAGLALQCNSIDWGSLPYAKRHTSADDTDSIITHLFPYYMATPMFLSMPQRKLRYLQKQVKKSKTLFLRNRQEGGK